MQDHSDAGLSLGLVHGRTKSSSFIIKCLHVHEWWVASWLIDEISARDYSKYSGGRSKILTGIWGEQFWGLSPGKLLLLYTYFMIFAWYTGINYLICKLIKVCTISNFSRKVLKQSRCVTKLVAKVGSICGTCGDNCKKHFFTVWRIVIQFMSQYMHMYCIRELRNVSGKNTSWESGSVAWHRNSCDRNGIQEWQPNRQFTNVMIEIMVEQDWYWVGKDSGSKKCVYMGKRLWLLVAGVGSDPSSTISLALLHLKNKPGHCMVAGGIHHTQSILHYCTSRTNLVIGGRWDPSILHYWHSRTNLVGHWWQGWDPSYTIKSILHYCKPKGTISLTFTTRRKMGILQRVVNRFHKAYDAL